MKFVCVRIGGIGSEYEVKAETIEIINFLPFPIRSHAPPSAPAKVAYVLLGRHGFVANGYIRAVRPFEIGEFVRKSFVKYIVEHLGSTGTFGGKYVHAVCTVHNAHCALCRHINSTQESKSRDSNVDFGQR